MLARVNPQPDRFSVQLFGAQQIKTEHVAQGIGFFSLPLSLVLLTSIIGEIVGHNRLRS
jgi:hypothetical protein